MYILFKYRQDTCIHISTVRYGFDSVVINRSKMYKKKKVKQMNTKILLKIYEFTKHFLYNIHKKKKKTSHNTLKKTWVVNINEK